MCWPPSAARGRHHGADPGQGQDRHRTYLDLCPRRTAFGGRAPPAADRLRLARSPEGLKPPNTICGTFAGILQADAHGGYNGLYAPGRPAGRSHRPCAGPMPGGSSSNWQTLPPTARRGKMAAAISPSRWRRSQTLDALFDIERDINGLTADQRLGVRREAKPATSCQPGNMASRRTCPAVTCSPRDEAYRLHAKRWDGFARFAEDGRICLTNNAA